MKLYHLTYKNRLGSIMETGLVPNKLDTFDYDRQEDVSHQEGVYLTTDVNFAQRMLDDNEFKMERVSKEDYLSGYTILEIDADTLDLTKIKMDQNVTGTGVGKSFLYNEVIQPELLTVTWDPTITYELDNSTYNFEMDTYFMSHGHDSGIDDFDADYTFDLTNWTSQKEPTLVESDFADLANDQLTK